MRRMCVLLWLRGVFVGFVVHHVAVHFVSAA